MMEFVSGLLNSTICCNVILKIMRKLKVRNKVRDCINCINCRFLICAVEFGDGPDIF
jgi:hypothetical protein